MIDVSSLECDALGRTQPGNGREQDHRSVPRPDRLRDRVEFRPRLERMLLIPSPHRIVDADLRRVDVNHSPRHGSLEHLPKRLGRLEAVASESRPPVR